MVLLDDFRRARQPVMGPLRGNICEIIRERRVLFILQPGMSRPIERRDTSDR